MGIYIRFRHGKTALYHILEQQKFVVSALFYGKISRISHSRVYSALRVLRARVRRAKISKWIFALFFQTSALRARIERARNWQNLHLGFYIIMLLVMACFRQRI